MHASLIRNKALSGQYIGIDTSCYTTSAACAENGSIVSDKRAMLRVASGERGLRQSDGVFQHVRNLAEIVPAVMADAERANIRAVAVSVRPRPEEDSYMPVFLAGKASAYALSQGLGVRVYELSHQQGHVGAALKGNEQLMDKPFLGMHISGGTTEIFTVSDGMRIKLIGGCDDLHAGQLVDRIGVAMGMSFPSGKHMERLASQFSGELKLRLPVWVRGCRCSFSGTESAAQRLIQSGACQTELAYAVYDAMARTFHKLIVNAACDTGIDCALIAGGVASSGLLRSMLTERMSKMGHIDVRFGEPALSSDNAAGIALMAEDIDCGRLEV